MEKQGGLTVLSKTGSVKKTSTTKPAKGGVPALVDTLAAPVALEAAEPKKDVKS